MDQHFERFRSEVPHLKASRRNMSASISGSRRNRSTNLTKPGTCAR
jgi:hypothetical protein